MINEKFMLKSLLLLETINSPPHRRFLKKFPIWRPKFMDHSSGRFSLDGGAWKVMQQRNRHRALSPRESPRPESLSAQTQRRCIFSVLFTSSGILIFRGRHSDPTSLTHRERFTRCRWGINQRTCTERGFTVETFLAAAATVNRLPRSQKKSSRRALKWQMKNYSRQFGDSKISDDVMIRADVSAQMGLTAAFSAKICEFYRPYPYFF